MTRLLALLLIMVADGALASLVAQGGPEIAECKPSAAINRSTGRPALSGCLDTTPPRRGRFKVRIVGGVHAPDERYTAAIFYTDTNGKPNICTGALLDSRTVLTAGHCGCGVPESYQVTFNQFARQPSGPDELIRIERSPIQFDPLACAFGIAPGQDLALLRLVKDVLKTPRDFGYPAFALAVDYQERMIRGEELKVVGYGKTETGGIATRKLAMIPVLTPDCFNREYMFDCAPFQEMIMADRTGSRGPRDSCEGDSGGPVYIRAEVRLPPCDVTDLQRQPEQPYENYLEKEKETVVQDVLVAVTSRAAPFAQPLLGGHCGGGSINTLIGRKSVHAWLEANGVRRQSCVAPASK
jgi:hypothetical protein